MSLRRVSSRSQRSFRSFEETVAMAKSHSSVARSQSLRSQRSQRSQSASSESRIQVQRSQSASSESRSQSQRSQSASSESRSQSQRSQSASSESRIHRSQSASSELKIQSLKTQRSSLVSLRSQSSRRNEPLMFVDQKVQKEDDNPGSDPERSVSDNDKGLGEGSEAERLLRCEESSTYEDDKDDEIEDRNEERYEGRDEYTDEDDKRNEDGDEVIDTARHCPSTNTDDAGTSSLLGEVRGEKSNAPEDNDQAMDSEEPGPSNTSDSPDGSNGPEDNEVLDTLKPGTSNTNDGPDVPDGLDGQSSTQTGPPNAAVPFNGPAPIEIVISFDTTGSMSNYLDEVKSKVQEIIQRLFMDIPSMKICVMAHGDYCDEDCFYLLKKVDFTNDVESLCQFVKDVGGTGGGDFAECYEWVLSQVRKLEWTPGTQRSLIMIGDAIPHESDYYLNKERLNWRFEADALYSLHGVKVYAVQCQDEKGAAEFWGELANRTHGRHLKLDQFGAIVDILMAICYREHSAEYFEAYEKEVRSRSGRHLAPELDDVFDTLRDGPKTANPKNKLSFTTVDLSKDASKNSKKKATPRPTAVKKGARKVDTVGRSKTGKKKTAPKRKLEASTSAGPPKKIRNLGVPTKNTAKATDKKSKAKQANKTNKNGPGEAKLVQKSRRKIKILRETIRGKKFALSTYPWSRWKLAMCAEAPDERGIWQERRKNRPGVKHTGLFSRKSHKAAVYEIAVGENNSKRKYVVYAKATEGFTKRSWESALLGRDRVQDEIDSILSSKRCQIYVRRLLFGDVKFKEGEVTKLFGFSRQLAAFLRSKYDYAWRFLRRDGSSRVSHRQLVVRSGTIISRDTIRRCTCVMCS